METKDIQTMQKRQLQICAIITLVLLLISFIWLFYNLYAYHEIKAKVISVDKIGIGIVIGFFPRGLLYFSFAYSLLLAYKLGVKFKYLGILGVVSGVVSSVSLVFDFAALSDIGKDYLQLGYNCIMEWTWLYFAFFIHLLFYIIGIITIIKIIGEVKSLTKDKKSIINEILFEITQYVGIVCGLIGIAFTTYAYIVLHGKQFISDNWLIWLILAYCVVIFLPYMSVILYWIIKLTMKDERSLYDERQKQEMALSGLIAWIISIPVMFVLLMINLGNIDLASAILWFPFYLFATLLIFSVSVLYNFKRT